MKGIVYWITGLSGAGKTTIGTNFYYKIKEANPQTVLLDGDVIKQVFSDKDSDYSKEGRKKRAYQYSRLCKMLSDQGISVICCTIAMYDEVRKWNRDNILNYLEVFIDVDIDLLEKRDVKGLYKVFTEGDQAMVGISAGVEFPKNPDLVIKNTMDNRIHEYVDLIIKCSDKSFANHDPLKQYWNEYYSDNNAPEEASDFAKFILTYTVKNKKIIDLGCGNGRDSIFFSNKGLKVTAIDLSEEAINKVSEKKLPIFAVCDDFTKAKVLFCVDYDYCYSRWTIHAVNRAQQTQMIDSVAKSLTKNGLFFIEVRTVNDPKYGKGENIGVDEFIYDNHYRRFIKPDELVGELEANGFRINYCQESNNFSVVGEDRPSLLRIIAEKM